MGLAGNKAEGQAKPLGLGGINLVMAKDVGLYLGEVAGGGGPSVMSEVVAGQWARFAAEEPGADFTRIYPWICGEG